MKKYISYILMIAVVGIAVFSPFGINTAEAGCFSLVPPKLDIMGCAAEAGNLTLKIMGVVLWVAGGIFDFAVSVSILNFSAYANMDGIMTGWTITRDVVNMFFIFIILYIAIATILQLSGYDTKKLLTTVILVALLVNFSAMITKVVIQSSNMLAYEFYDAIKPPKINGQKESLSGVFVSGLKLTSVYKAQDKDVKAPVQDQLTPTGLIFATFGGSLLILITAFVLFAGAVLLIYRAIALLFLIVLSPLAFVAMVLPGTKQHATKWWTELFSQSFFAPAYMFMIYLVAKMITSGSLAKATGTEKTDGLLDPLFRGTDLNIIVYFVILIGFMIGGLIVAKSMGAHGATMVTNWGQKLQGKAQGYAKGVGKRSAGYIPEKIIDEKSWINRKTGGRIAKVGTLPLVGRGLAQVSSLRKQEIDKKNKAYKKHYSSYSNAGLSAALKDPLIRKGKKDVLEGIQKEREEKGIKGRRKEELRKVVDDSGQNATTRLAAMKMLGELDVETELESVKTELESEKSKSSDTAQEKSSA